MNYVPAFCILITNSLAPMADNIHIRTLKSNNFAETETEVLFSWQGKKTTNKKTTKQPNIININHHSLHYNVEKS